MECQVKSLTDQLEFTKREKEGIEQSLQKMVGMYKEIIAEMEVKHEERLRKVQYKFTEEMQRVILDKEEEAKYFTAQREALEAEIACRDEKIEELGGEVAQLSKDKGQLQTELEQLIKAYNSLETAHEQLEKKREEEGDKAREQYNALKQEYVQAEADWKTKLRE